MYQQAKTSAGNHSQSAASGSTSSPENKSSQMETIPSPNPIPSSTGDAGPSDPKQLRSKSGGGPTSSLRKKEYVRKLEREAKEAEYKRLEERGLHKFINVRVLNLCPHGGDGSSTDNTWLSVQPLTNMNERVAMLASQVAFQRMHLTILSGENSQMRERLQVLENHQAHKEAETEALVKERETLLLLRSLQLQQQQGGSSSSNNPNNVDK
ncbi:Basic-leucine zipper transcription factor family protein [Prunus dulcis]|uniref:Basic-leucine zipper transcription factor family protein n=1 Tax=Prunus dulcis TaxID=3755 RepID=A0A4Y1RPM9_PRUDU|nr:Basic-leucine zipper transcription factor family protein [Prunus dulcis]